MFPLRALPILALACALAACQSGSQVARGPQGAPKLMPPQSAPAQPLVIPPGILPPGATPFKTDTGTSARHYTIADQDPRALRSFFESALPGATFTETRAGEKLVIEGGNWHVEITSNGAGLGSTLTYATLKEARAGGS